VDCAPGWGETIPRRIAVINEKGGSGKTTLVANLAAHLALGRRRRVLALDLDPQGQLGKVLGADVRGARRSAIDLLLDAVLDSDPLHPAAAVPASAEHQELPRVPSRIPRLDLIVANKALALHPGLCAEEGDPTARLARSLDEAPACADYDFVLIDAPPSFGPLTLSLLRAAHEVVIPVPLTYLALDGCAELLRTLHTVRTRYGNPALQVTMVVPTFYRRTRLAHELLDRLKEQFPKELAHTVLGFHVKVDEAQSRGLSIFEYAPKDRAARAFSALAEELELRAPAPGDAG
jgi:chromosome partitioning protein